MDFMPTTFIFSNPAYPPTRVQTALAKQLALYVVLYSPIKAAPDMPENYVNQYAFEFIRAILADWKINPYPIVIEEMNLNSDAALDLHLAPG